MPDEPLLTLRQVGKSFGSGENVVHALVEASIDFYRGELVLIEGPSGSGKTTMLSITGCILRPTTGSLTVASHDVLSLGERQLPAIRARYFGYIFQHYHLFSALTAVENVEMMLRMKFGAYPQAREEARRLLGQVGLGKRLTHKPEKLSGGERQRVAIARALAGNPTFVLADEPTAALDTENAMAVVSLLKSLAVEEQRTVVIVSHDYRLESFADRIVRMQDGRVLSITATSP